MQLEEKIKGIDFCYHMKAKPWRVRIAIDGTRKHIGYFSTREEAWQAYKQVAIENDKNGRLFQYKNHRDYYLKNKTKYQRYHEKNKEKRNKKKKENNWNRRLDIIKQYGGKCVCCGESTPEFLSIDHIHGNGLEHRKLLKKQNVNIYQWLKDNGYPKEDYQLLCMNCNTSKGFFGYCPHNKSRENICHK